MKLRIALIVFAATLLPPVSKTAFSQPASPSWIAIVRDGWVADWNLKDLNALLSLYADNAVLSPSSGQRIIGKDAIAAYFKEVLASGAGDLTVNNIDADQSGRLAYYSGTYKYTNKGGGTTLSGAGAVSRGGSRQVRGSFLIVLDQQPDGKWLIVQHISTEAPAPPSQ